MSGKDVRDHTITRDKGNPDSPSIDAGDHESPDGGTRPAAEATDASPVDGGSTASPPTVEVIVGAPNVTVGAPDVTVDAPNVTADASDVTVGSPDVSIAAPTPTPTVDVPHGPGHTVDAPPRVGLTVDAPPAKASSAAASTAPTAPDAPDPPRSRSGDSYSRIGDSYSRTTGGTSRRHLGAVDRDATHELYGGRYEDEGVLDLGGMGEVRQVYDHLLRRTLAVKVMRADRLGDARSRHRFLAEARINARLQHPGVVAVYDRGELDDGRPWFAMRRIKGRTLDATMAAHFAGEPDAPPRRRLVDALARVARTIAYAHVHRVLHRDLKPANIMLGEFGEVLVVDWGIARVDDVDDDPRDGARDEGAHVTVDGRIVGTLAYMAPEQARGDRAAMGPAADVYALGAILYHMLAGRPPYGGRTASAHAALLAGPPVPLAERALPAPLPPELADLCARAMSRDPEARPDADAFAAELEGWLDGLRKRDRALELVTEADAMRPRIEALRAEIDALRHRAAQLLRALPAHAPAHQKAPGWTLEDRAQTLRGEVQVLEVRMAQVLRAALEVVAELPEAHARLAAHYRDQVDAAEAERDFDRATVYTELVRIHDRGEQVEWLAGDGAVTVITDPPGARVRHRIFDEDQRALIELEVGELGRTPLVRAPLPRGSHLLVIERDGHADVRYPVCIGRGEHWDGIRPGDTDATPIHLPGAGAIPSNVRYVPAGWTRVGGDLRAAEALPRRRVWVDAFLVDRFAVTHARYIEFLESMPPDVRAPFVPHIPGEGPIYASRGSRFELIQPGPYGWSWALDWPAVFIDHASANAFARWQARRDGLAWRLPHAIEREKAARGTDGRSMPWGDFFEPTWANVAKARPGSPCPAPVGAFETDESLYGIRGLVGNVKDWCINDFDAGDVPEGSVLKIDPARPGRDIEARGGGWHSHDYVARPAARFAAPPGARYNTLGFRLAASWPPTPG